MVKKRMMANYSSSSLSAEQEIQLIYICANEDLGWTPRIF